MVAVRCVCMGCGMCSRSLHLWCVVRCVGARCVGVRCVGTCVARRRVCVCVCDCWTQVMFSWVELTGPRVYLLCVAVLQRPPFYNDNSARSLQGGRALPMSCVHLVYGLSTTASLIPGAAWTAQCAAMRSLANHSEAPPDPSRSACAAPRAPCPRCADPHSQLPAARPCGN